MDDDAHAGASWPPPYLAPEGTWVCTHHGYPLIPLPGANVFLTAADESTPDGAITCKQISGAESVRLAGDGARLLARLIELL